MHWRYVQASADHHHINVKTSQTDRIDMRGECYIHIYLYLSLSSLLLLLIVEVVIDFGRQHVITKDTVSIDIDALVVRFLLFHLFIF